MGILSTLGQLPAECYDSSLKMQTAQRGRQRQRRKCKGREREAETAYYCALMAAKLAAN